MGIDEAHDFPPGRADLAGEIGARRAQDLVDPPQLSVLPRERRFSASMSVDGRSWRSPVSARPDGPSCAGLVMHPELLGEPRNVGRGSDSRYSRTARSRSSSGYFSVRAPVPSFFWPSRSNQCSDTPAKRGNLRR